MLGDEQIGKIALYSLQRKIRMRNKIQALTYACTYEMCEYMVYTTPIILYYAALYHNIGNCLVLFYSVRKLKIKHLERNNKIAILAIVW